MCLPLIVFVLLASVDICTVVFQDYDVHAAAFEVSKVALQRTATCEDVQLLASEILPQIGFDDYSIQIDVEDRTVNTFNVVPTSISGFSIPQSGATPTGLDEIPRGTVLRLTLIAKRPASSIQGIFRTYIGNDARADCVFVKEF